MKRRKEAVVFIEALLNDDVATKREKKLRIHFGFQEMRDVLDFIYEGEPSCEREFLVNRDPATREI